MKPSETKPPVFVPPMLAPVNSLLGTGLDTYLKSLVKAPAPPVEQVFYAWLMFLQKSIETTAAAQNLLIASSLGLIPRSA
jgi:hypothetical protein